MIIAGNSNSSLQPGEAVETDKIRDLHVCSFHRKY